MRSIVYSARRLEVVFANLVDVDIFQDKSLASGVFFLDLLGAVEPRVVNWNIVTSGLTGKCV